MNLDAILTSASGALTPIVAVLALYIAYRQYRIERHAAKIELFEHRFTVYTSTLNYVFARWQGDAVSPDVSRAFSAAIERAPFLFGRDVCDVLDEVEKRGRDITVADAMRRARPLEEEMGYVYTMRDQQQWFAQAEPGVARAFAKYLNVGWLR